MYAGDVETGQKVATIKGGRNIPELGGHTDEILALALSSDGKYAQFHPISVIGPST